MDSSKSYKIICFAAMSFAVLLAAGAVSYAAEGKDWHFNGTVIEACSCPMFCQCYFNTEPALNTPNMAQSTFASSTWLIK